MKNLEVRWICTLLTVWKWGSEHKLYTLVFLVSFLRYLTLVLWKRSSFVDVVTKFHLVLAYIASYSMGTRNSFLGVKLTTHLHLVAEVKNAWSYTSASLIVFMVWCLVKHRDNCTFTFRSAGSLQLKIICSGTPPPHVILHQTTSVLSFICPCAPVFCLECSISEIARWTYSAVPGVSRYASENALHSCFNLSSYKMAKLIVNWKRSRMKELSLLRY
jgi:hypothetical protein